MDNWYIDSQPDDRPTLWSFDSGNSTYAMEMGFKIYQNVLRGSQWSLKVIRNFAILQATYYLLLVIYSNLVSVLYRFQRDIFQRLQNFPIPRINYRVDLRRCLSYVSKVGEHIGPG